MPNSEKYAKEIEYAKNFCRQHVADKVLQDFIQMKIKGSAFGGHAMLWSDCFDFIAEHYPEEKYTCLDTGLAYYIEEQRKKGQVK